MMKKITRRDMVRGTGISTAGLMLQAPLFLTAGGKIRSVKDKLKIVVTGAHPDDPESGCGGTMALLAAEGHEVVSAYLTRGEAGIEGKTHEEAARIRTAEAEAACRILKVRPAFLGQIDGSTEITPDRYDELYQFLIKESPDLVITHWPVDTHRDHRICSILTYDAWLRLDKKFPLFYFEVMSGIQTQNFTPTHFVDIGKVVDQKGAACMAHASQDPDDFYLDVHKKMEKFRGIQFNCQFAEAFVRHNQNPPVQVSLFS